MIFMYEKASVTSLDFVGIATKWDECRIIQLETTFICQPQVKPGNPKQSLTIGKH
jgi:hypothetical protein